MGNHIGSATMAAMVGKWETDEKAFDPARTSPMKYRKLRIAWSVAWGVVAVLLVVWWVRSYWVGDAIYLNVSGRIILASKQGIVSLSTSSVHFDNSPALQWKSARIDSMMSEIGLRPSWGIRANDDGTSIRFPYRLPIAACILTAIGPWVATRFSLRTLLIATTLVAVVLGAVAYAMR